MLGFKSQICASDFTSRKADEATVMLPTPQLHKGPCRAIAHRSGSWDKASAPPQPQTAPSSKSENSFCFAKASDKPGQGFKFRKKEKQHINARYQILLKSVFQSMNKDTTKGAQRTSAFPNRLDLNFVIYRFFRHHLLNYSQCKTTLDMQDSQRCHIP